MRRTVSEAGVVSGWMFVLSAVTLFLTSVNAWLAIMLLEVTCAGATLPKTLTTGSHSVGGELDLPRSPEALGIGFLGTKHMVVLFPSTVFLALSCDGMKN